MPWLSRRALLKAGGGAVGALAIGGALPTRAQLSPTVDRDARLSPLVRRIVRSPENTYFTYPHSNGFMPDGRAVLASPTQATKGVPGLAFIAFDPKTGDVQPLCHVRDTRMYWSISDNGIMLLSQREGAAVVDLNHRNPSPRRILDERNWTVHGDNDISGDGKWALLTLSRHIVPKAYRTIMVETATGRIITIMAPGWSMDHAHFSPFDQSWISLCANRTNRDPERMWVWHAESAPRGRQVFKQTTLAGTFFHVGHERAMFHKPAILTIAYGTSSATPRGLYAVGFDGTVKLISESNRDLHCNISRDGTWAVVSLQGRYAQKELRPTPDWLNSEGKFGFTDVVAINMASGRRAFLHEGTNAATGQPYEVQPSISPDGKWVLLKDAREQRVLFLEIDQLGLQRLINQR